MLMLRNLTKNTFQRRSTVYEELRYMSSSSRKNNRKNARRGHSQRLRNAVTAAKLKQRSSGDPNHSEAQKKDGAITAFKFLGVMPLVGTGLLIGLNDEMKEQFLELWR